MTADTYRNSKIIVRIGHPRWYLQPPLAHGLTGKWLETKHNLKGGHYIIGNIDVDVEKFNLDDPLFL